MDEIKIDKGIPIPSGGHGRRAKYPWHEMEVGDSFFVSGGTNNKGFVSYANRRFAPKRFLSRTVEGGTRVWRLE